MSNSPDIKAADNVIFANGVPPQGPADTAENERAKAAALEGVAHGMTLPNEEDVFVGAPGCQRCEVLPAPIKGPGTLYLCLPHTHSLGKILSYLADSKWTHKEHDGTVSIRVGAGSLAPLLSPILDRLSPTEQRDARARFQADDHLLENSLLFEIDSLADFAAKARSEWLLDILRQKRLRAVFQPIMKCGRNEAPDEVYGYECLMRAEVADEIVTAGPMLDMARSADLLFQFDLAARRAAITSAATHHITQKLFINFMPNAIYNPVSCLESTVRMIDEVGLERARVVFEIVESERLPEMGHLKRIVRYYRERGFGVALDDLGSGFSSLNVLVELQPDYVKLDMALVRNVHADRARSIVARKLLETAQELELKTIAEGVETPDELAWVRQHGADFVQGYYFARPSAPPPLM